MKENSVNINLKSRRVAVKIRLLYIRYKNTGTDIKNEKIKHKTLPVRGEPCALWGYI